MSATTCRTSSALRSFFLAVPLAAAALAAGCGGDLPTPGPGGGAVCGVLIDASAADVLTATMRSTTTWDCGSGAPAQGIPANVRANDLEVLSVEKEGASSLRVEFRVAGMRPEQPGPFPSPCRFGCENDLPTADR